MAVSHKLPNGIKKSMDIGHRIEIIRERQGLTREELAERLNVSPTTIFRKERGQGTSARQIKLKELPRWAKALDVSIEDIMNLEDNKQSDRELGLIGLIQLLFSIMVARNLVNQDNLKEILENQIRFFKSQNQNQQGAIEVTETLLDSLGLKPHESKIEAIRKLLLPVQA